MKKGTKQWFKSIRYKVETHTMASGEMIYYIYRKIGRFGFWHTVDWDETAKHIGIPNVPQTHHSMDAVTKAITNDYYHLIKTTVVEDNTEMYMVLPINFTPGKGMPDTLGIKRTNK